MVKQNRAPSLALNLEMTGRSIIEYVYMSLLAATRVLDLKSLFRHLTFLLCFILSIVDLPVA
jgi:hypothetical protein